MTRHCCLLGILLLALAAAAGAAPRVLRIHAVPVVAQGRFLHTLLAPFATAQDISLEIASHHGREVVAAAGRGEADLIVTHADFPGAAELTAEARLGRGEIVFANPIALLAPPDDPGGARSARSPEEALAQIAQAGRCLMPNNLKHLREFQPRAGMPPTCGGAADAGSGLGAVLAAVAREAYVWWGLHPFLNAGQPLTPLLLDDPRLLRPLMAWAVAAGDTALAEAAIAYLRAPTTQAAVTGFRLPGRPDVQAWWPYAALDRLAAIRARGALVVALKNEGARAADEHRDPAHVAKRSVELRIAQALAADLTGDASRLVIRTLRKPARLPAVAGGDADLGIAMFAIGDTARRLVDFSVPYFEDGIAVMHRKEEVFPVAGSLAGRRLLVLARDALGRAEEQRSLERQLVAQVPSPTPVTSFDEAATLLENGQADALVAHAANIDAYLARRASAALARSPLLQRTRYGVALPRDNPNLKARVDAVLSGLVESGELVGWSAEAGLASGTESVGAGGGRGQGAGDGSGGHAKSGGGGSGGRRYPRP
jgi:putative glutamine transport system substrate-binding protein